MPNEKLRIAYIGGGSDHCADSHAPFMGRSALYAVVGIAEKDPDRLYATRNLPGLTEWAIFTNDYTELLDDDSTDAVLITTGDSSHLRIAQDAINADKHVYLEKPAAVTIEELAVLPELFDRAEANGRRFWVCHPREFGDGPWREAARLIGNPTRISEVFGVGPMGRLQELRYDCHYTLPSNPHELHPSFADDKLNHTIVSILRALPKLLGFRDAVLFKNTSTMFDARLVTIPEDDKTDPVTIYVAGRRSAHKENQGSGVYRDWIEAIFDEGVLRVEPSLGWIQLTYGKQEIDPIIFDPKRLYDDMFGAINTEFAQCALDPRRPEPISTRAKLLGTAAAILMQHDGFDGLVTEAAVHQLRNS